jgi:peptide/nickel transport system ATP-binding protein/oligopeptide transport system ATP-binding protein
MERGTTTAPLLELRNAAKHFELGRGFLARRTLVRAVDGVDLAIQPEETVGLVGESGCGKTTLGRMIVRLERPTAGEILFQGRDVWAARGPESRALHRAIQMVFQDPYGSLNPRKRLREILRVPLLVNGLADGRSADAQVAALLQEVRLPPALAGRYPAQLSGGQQQRVAIARAISVRPSLLVADEPLSALDVSVQAQVLHLLQRIRDERRLSLLFISHDLAVVRHLCDRVLVMYLGKIVEQAATGELFARPRHPYTAALLSAVPTTRPRRRPRIVLSGEVASAAQIPPGCRFHTRCWKAQAICRQVEPPLQRVGASVAACHFPVEDGEMDARSKI